MIFNDSKKDYILLRGKKTPFFAPLNRSFKKIDSKLIKTDRGPRIIPVYVHIEYDSFSDFEKVKEDIAKWLVHDEPKKLEFEDDADRFYWAVINETIEYDKPLPTAVDATISFICGYKYSQERKLTINGGLVEHINGHKSTPWRTITRFSEARSSYELTFNSPNKTDLRDINKIRLNYNFIRGDVLEIDYSKRKITVNGKDITNSLVILQSNFIELPIGEVTLSVSHSTELFYHERYY